ncbi:arginine decarboxylase [Klebsiella pneumoniae]|nr:arginine decarboxylase [Klebsiella pneumoniae]
MLGFFMVGAYQEILGNMHNLFGDTEAVDVFVFPDGSVEVELSDEGDTVADMLQYVQLDPKTLLTQFRDQVKKTDLDAELQQQFLEEFEAGLYGYTYLAGRFIYVNRPAFFLYILKNNLAAFLIK